MATTRNTLESISSHLEESMGVRTNQSQPRLAPVPHPKDAGRMPLRDVGRISIDMVVPDPGQPREEFSEESLDRLTSSIRDKGQLCAIRVRWSEATGKWVIVSGERRWRAAKLAAMKSIDCYFHENGLTDSEVLEEQLIENCLREDLRPIEEARAFATLMVLNRWNGRQLASQLRIPPSKVSRAIAMLKLPADIQAQVTSGEISARAAYELSRLDNEHSRRDLAQKAAAGTLTLEQAQKAVRQRKGKARPQTRCTRQTFSTEDGWKVVVSARRKGTYHEIEQALVVALEEVRLRIANNVQLF